MTDCWNYARHSPVWLLIQSTKSLIVRCSVCQTLGRLAHIPIQGNTVVSIGVEGYIVHKKYSCQSLSFISIVALLLAALDSTPTESHRNTSMALLPVSRGSTPTELLTSPLCARRLSLFRLFHFPFGFFLLFLFSFFFKLCITLIHFIGGRGIPTC